MPQPHQFGRFFRSITQYNHQAFQGIKLQQYLSSLPPPQLMITTLQQQGYFRKQVFSRVPQRIEDILKTDGFNLQQINKTPIELLKEPAQFSFTGKAYTDMPAPYHPLIPVIKNYVDTLINVLNDRLARRDYDPNEEINENLSERGHALESLVITHHLRDHQKKHFSSLTLLHDIARATMADVHYGHLHHNQESQEIIKPLGYSQNVMTCYPLLHTLAKYLWYTFSSEYKEQLISPLSKDSLTQQENNATALMKKLDAMYSSPKEQNQHQLSEQLIVLMSRMMCLRLIDDSAKVVLPKAPPLVTTAQLKTLLTEQVIAHVQTLSEEQLEEYKEAMKEGLRLLRRTRFASDYPHRYNSIEGEDALLESAPTFKLQ